MISKLCVGFEVTIILGKSLFVDMGFQDKRSYMYIFNWIVIYVRNMKLSLDCIVFKCNL